MSIWCDDAVVVVVFVRMLRRYHMEVSIPLDDGCVALI